MKCHKIKSYLTLLLSSEIIIKPGKSRVYLRFVLVLYFFSIALICYSSIYLVIKLTFTFIILIKLYFDFTHQSPCPTILEIREGKQKWILLMNNGSSFDYDEASILIHNTLFQLIELSCLKKKKLLILFNDQIPIRQLRLLHLKTSTK